ncbi:MAG TPA: glycoside hydrolase family 19 protein, partial [Nevskiales bacterium]|nr:glycoside hydrolase family 19 protein [Nevskiales bacterium]
MTKDQLKAFCPAALRFYDGLIATFERFEINTPKRQAQFLAQVAHESGGFRYVRELASGAAYDTGRLATRLGNTPAKDGDGQKYKGRGLIQVTGTGNYRACSRALFGDDRLLKNPQLLEDPINACLSAGWYWNSRKLNAYADADRFT